MSLMTNPRRSSVALALGAVLLLAGACGNEAEVRNAADASATRSTTTLKALSADDVVDVAPATTSAPVVTSRPATATRSGSRFSRPADAVRHLYEAWRRGSRSDAGEAASASAVQELFARRSTPLAGSECNRASGDARCFMDGDGFSAIFEVAADLQRGHRVIGVSFATHENSEQEPTAVATPGKAKVGDTVRVEGRGFVGDPYTAEDAPFYLVGGSEDCALYALTRDTLVVDDHGRLSGTFVVPSTGDCRMAGREAAVTPGRYELAYACTACIVGEFEVAAS